jgi:hypothetical protein
MAGNNSATKMPMMAITTKSSTRVKPALRASMSASFATKPNPLGTWALNHASRVKATENHNGKILIAVDPTRC